MASGVAALVKTFLVVSLLFVIPVAPADNTTHPSQSPSPAPTPAPTPTCNADTAALVDIFSNVVGLPAQWNANSSQSPCACSEWLDTFLFCDDSNDHIKALTLDYFPNTNRRLLSGVLSASIDWPSDMRSIHLENQLLSGTVIHDWGAFPAKLKYLRLIKTRISGDFHASQLPAQLISLQLPYNGFSVGLGDSTSAFAFSSSALPPTLRDVDLSYNQLHGAVFIDFGANASMLSSIDLRHNLFSSVVFGQGPLRFDVYLDITVICDTEVHCAPQQFSESHNRQDSQCNSFDSCRDTCACDNNAPTTTAPTTTTTAVPSSLPSTLPTIAPTAVPTLAPTPATDVPTSLPTHPPTDNADTPGTNSSSTPTPTRIPTTAPTRTPLPTAAPTAATTAPPTSPTIATDAPTAMPTINATLAAGSGSAGEPGAMPSHIIVGIAIVACILLVAVVFICCRSKSLNEKKQRLTELIGKKARESGKRAPQMIVRPMSSSKQQRLRDDSSDVTDTDTTGEELSSTAVHTASKKKKTKKNNKNNKNNKNIEQTKKKSKKKKNKNKNAKTKTKAKKKKTKGKKKKKGKVKYRNDVNSDDEDDSENGSEEADDKHAGDNMNHDDGNQELDGIDFQAFAFANENSQESGTQSDTQSDTQSEDDHTVSIEMT